MAPDPGDPSALWRGQPTEDFRMSTAALAAAAAREHRRLRAQTVAQYAATSAALAATAYFAAVVDVPLIRLGLAGAAAAFLLVLGVLRRTAAVRDAGLGAAALAEPSLAHYRAELARQRDQLSGPRLWLRFAVAIPAGLVIMLGIARARPDLVPIVRWELLAFAVAMPLAAVVGRRRARRFQTRIDALDALAHGDALPPPRADPH